MKWDGFSLTNWLIGFFALWGIAFTTLLGLATYSEENAISNAFFSMSLGLVLLWVVLGGLLMRFFREPIRRFVLAIPLAWQAKFVLFCILLAMLEEAVTTTMTNLAPVFGVAYGQAYITASGNYLDVIFFHSVVVFVPMFIAWAYLLQNYAFSPNAAFLCFGVTGVLAESISFGFQNFINMGFWIFVYGLMIYLPVYALPEREKARIPHWWHYPLVILFPILVAILFIILMELGKSLVGIPTHPAIHFFP